MNFGHGKLHVRRAAIEFMRNQVSIEWAERIPIPMAIPTPTSRMFPSRQPDLRRSS
jgi:hypothetical protein